MNPATSLPPQVFAPDTTQERLYATAVSGMVEEVLEGFNCTIFAYGQTGTGKTHTMTGDIGDELGPGAGVIPRAIHQIFGHLESMVRVGVGGGGGGGVGGGLEGCVCICGGG